MHSRKQSGKPDLARAFVDGMRAAKHLRNVCDSELDGSPNKGAKKKICKLATIFEECVLKGSRAANMGYAVDARYNEEFGHTSLEDLDKLASPSGGAASACATAEKQPRSRSLFRVEDTTESRPNLRVKLRKIGLVDVPQPKHGREYTPLEATEILLDLREKCKKVQLKPIINAWIEQKYIPIQYIALNDRFKEARDRQNAGEEWKDFVQPWNNVGRPKYASVADTERFAMSIVGDDQAQSEDAIENFVHEQKRKKRAARNMVRSVLVCVDVSLLCALQTC